jgi:IS5 family transposase
MQRKSSDPTFVDGVTAGLGGPKSQAFFDQCERLIPWSQLAASIGDIFAATPKGGRPHWPVVLMLKCLMLQKWFNLSDPQVEEVLQDRLSFRRFVGLSLEDGTPDETTFCRFRDRLVRAGHADTLFEGVLAHLRSEGLVMSEGTLVDARIIDAPRGSKRPDGTSTTDATASYTVKHGQPRFGYKMHIATDPRGIIKHYVFDTASVKETSHADELIGDEQHAVYADSAYTKKERREYLTARGAFCGITYRRARGQAEIPAERRRHNHVCAGKRAIVEHPFAWMANAGYRKTRYRGLIRNAFDGAMQIIAYNLRRAFSLRPAPA